MIPDGAKLPKKKGRRNNPPHWRGQKGALAQQPAKHGRVALLAPVDGVAQYEGVKVYTGMLTVIALVLFFSLLCSLLAIQIYGFWKLRAYHSTLNTAISSLDRTITRTINEGIAHIEDSISVSTELRLRHSLLPMRGWAVQPDIVLELIYHVGAERPEVIVECGSGVSTVALARCVQMNGIGHVFSLEHLPEIADKTRQELARHGLASFATVFTSPLQPYEINCEQWLWYSLDSLRPYKIDLLVIDGPPGNTCHLARYPAGPLLFKYLSTHAAVFLDDASRSEEREIVKRWSLEFPTYKQQLRATQCGCAVLRRETQEEVLHRLNARSIAALSRGSA